MPNSVSEELYYARTHEWALVDENVVTVGLTGFRLHQLGDILFLDMPEVGKTVRLGEVFFSIESTKHIHDFAGPVSGTVIEINETLVDDLGRLNDDPFGDGWILRIEMEKESDLTSLMKAPEYRKQISASLKEEITAQI
jgi:glycine cleavage system H protein